MEQSWGRGSEDDMTHVDPANLLKDLQIALGMTLSLSNDAILPYEIDAMLKDAKRKIEEEILPYADKRIDIASINRQLESLIDKYDEFNNIRDSLRDKPITDDRVRLANRLTMKIQRCLSYAFYTFTDRFEQDSYDYTPMMYRPIPFLWTAVDLARLDPDTEAYKIKYTTVLRNRNRVSEAVNEALEYCDLFMALLK